MGLKIKESKSAQVTVFIIIAIVLVIGIFAFFALKGKVFPQSVPQEFKSAYEYYLSCIDSDTSYGSKLLGQGAGYIDNPNFSPGSAYMPFSSQLGFMGNGIPYWEYISGNGLFKEQVPSKESMQNQLNNFLTKQIGTCDFSVLESSGYVFVLGDVKNVESKINDGNIDVSVKQDVLIIHGNSSWIRNSHSINTNSNLGNFYNLAKKIYNYEKKNLFLENYGVDVLRLYAPVDGVEITCSPKIWNLNEVFENITSALEANIFQLKLKGDYYTLSKEENKYFVKDIGEDIDANINFLYSKNFPIRMQVWPSDSGILQANPVGNQQGLGMLGFCYVPYHFVYDLGYPVLIQIYAEDELFQFPVVVYINKNKPRESLNGSSSPNAVEELCNNKLSNVVISTYNKNFNPVEANIKYKCFNTECNIGKSVLNNSVSSFSGGIPQCVNGLLIVSSEGYATKKYLVTDMTQNTFDIIMDKQFKLNLQVKTGGKESMQSIVTFTKDNETKTVAYPEQNTVELTEGQYQIKVYSYDKSSITIPSSTTQKCVSVSKSGVLGFFGATEEKCFDMQIPEQSIESAVNGGGVQNYYISQSELENFNKMIIYTEAFDAPSKIEDISSNYNLIDNTGLEVSFEK